jgi:hypothetical protein
MAANRCVFLSEYRQDELYQLIKGTLLRNYANTDLKLWLKLLLPFGHVVV